MTIFILSHNRVASCPTLSLLDKLNYTGIIKIVVDNEDPQLDEYRNKYKEKLLVFNKNSMIGIVDTAFSKATIIKSSPIYARVFIDLYAMEYNLGDYIVLDDDIKNFKFRVPKGDSLPTYPIGDFNKLLSYLFNFMQNKNIYALSFAHQGMFIGGVKSFDEEKIMGKRVASNVWLLNSNKPFTWQTIFYDDYNSCLLNGQKGKLIFTIPFICTEMEKQGGQVISSKKLKDNGMGEAYKNTTQLQRCLYSTIVSPSSCTVKEVKRDGNWWVRLNKETQFPKIVSDRFKK